MNAASPAITGFGRVVLGLALIWGLFALAIVYGMATARSFGHAATESTLAACVLACIGAIATARYRAWGAALYVLASLALVVKGFLLRAPDAPYQFDWGYLVLLVLFVALVAANWPLFRVAPSSIDAAVVRR